MTPEQLQHRIEESERMLAAALDQAQASFEFHRDAARLARDVAGAQEAHALNVAVALAERDYAQPAQEPCRVRLYRIAGDEGTHGR